MSNMNSDKIKAAVASYFRYDRQYPVVAFEANSRLGWGYLEQADILVVTKDRRLIEVEVKVSMSDFLREKKKPKHRIFKTGIVGYYPTTYFYFAVPRELANDISVKCGNFYPYAGVLGTNGGFVQVYKNPKLLNNDKIDFKHILYLVRSQSATLCRLAKLIANHNDNIKDGENEQFTEGEGTPPQTV